MSMDYFRALYDIARNDGIGEAMRFDAGVTMVHLYELFNPMPRGEYRCVDEEVARSPDGLRLHRRGVEPIY